MSNSKMHREEPDTFARTIQNLTHLLSNSVTTWLLAQFVVNYDDCNLSRH